MEETMPQQAENLEQEIEIPTEGDSSQEVVVEASSVNHEEEIEQYSDKVQKRIDKLTYNQREAERQRDEALRVAQALKDKVHQFENKAAKSDEALFKEYNGRVITELEQAKDKYRKAIESGDLDAQVDTQQDIAKLAVEQETLARAKKQREHSSNGNKPQRQQAPQAPPIDPRATTWAQKEENSWFGRDEAMTAAAFALDKKMQEEGIDPTVSDYYEQLDERIQNAFPHKFEKEGKSPPVQAVGRTSVGTNPNTRKSKKVRLTASQQAIAKKLGVPLEEYAKYV
jgi:hypothetical protein|tara:strand:- start:890 stop:1741 length:852 start_codon:yes stop_codon:yes gene_type:complete